MSDPIAFPSSTPSLGLPLLFAGQAQKEFFVNQSLCIIDALHMRVVVESRPTPPATPGEGECFRVTMPATLAWEGYENNIAVWIGGAWHFISPQAGMHIFDRAAGHTLVFGATWQTADAPLEPSGGSVVDAEARAVIAQLIQSLKAVGVLRTTDI